MEMSRVEEEAHPKGRRAPIPEGTHRLDDSSLPKDSIAKLMRLGYLTVEQVYAASRTIGKPLDVYAGADIGRLLAGATFSVPERRYALTGAIQAPFSRGARLRSPVTAVLPHIPSASFARSPSIGTTGAHAATGGGPPPGGVNLIPQMQPIRDQGDRGTCVAFASVACMEQFLFGMHPVVDLSEQFQYWNCKQHDGSPNGYGTFLRIGMPLLATNGCCDESVWPYVSTTIVGNEAQGPPPPNAQAASASRKTPGYKQLNPTAIANVKQELAAGRCVAISVAFYGECWLTDEIKVSGNITLPIPGEGSNEGHAVCVVGYEDLPGSPELGGGWFMIRNSWNSYWATSGAYGVGYGTLPYAYLATYGSEAYSVA